MAIHPQSVFNNDVADGSFGTTLPIFLDNLVTKGSGGNGINTVYRVGKYRRVAHASALKMSANAPATRNDIKSTPFYKLAA